MTPTMKTTPIPDNTMLDDLHPARFLKVEDLTERWKVTELTVTVCAMAMEDTVPNTADMDEKTRKPRIVPQPVLYFKTKTGEKFPRGYLLSAGIDAQNLKSATHAQKVGEVLGKKITIILGDHKGKTVLRISPKPPE